MKKNCVLCSKQVIHKNIKIDKKYICVNCVNINKENILTLSDCTNNYYLKNSDIHELTTYYSLANNNKKIYLRNEVLNYLEKTHLSSNHYICLQANQKKKTIEQKQFKKENLMKIFCQNKIPWKMEFLYEKKSPNEIIKQETENIKQELKKKEEMFYLQQSLIVNKTLNYKNISISDIQEKYFEKTTTVVLV